MRLESVTVRLLLAGACSLLLLIAGTLSAQEEAPPLPAAGPLVLDPDSAAALAVQNSTQLGIDAQTLIQAEAQLRQAAAIDNPRLGLSATLVRRGPEPNLPEGFESFYIKTIHSESLTASKLLWDWGKTRAMRDAAREGVDLARLSAEVTRHGLALLARESVLMLAHDEYLLDVDYQMLASLMEHQRVAEKRYREGLVAFFEVAQAESHVEAARTGVADRLAGIDQWRVALRRVLNIDQTTPIEVSVGREPDKPDMTLEEAIAYALEERPEMKQARTALRLQEASMRLARNSLNPTVSVQAQVTDQTASFASRPITYQIALAFEQPLYDGGTNKAEVREAIAGAEAARLQLEQLSEAIAAEVATQYVQLDELPQRIVSAEASLRAALEQLRIARLRFEEDMSLGYEVIDAQAAVTEGQTARANAKLDLQLTITRLRAAMGMDQVREATEE
jgi:outer membrane protein TolC